MGRAIQAQCKKLSDIQISDFHAREFDSNSVSALIDFSVPDGFTEALNFCVENKIPFISGTTGLSAKHLEGVTTAKKIIPILIASNMSLGIANLKNSIERIREKGKKTKVFEVFSRFLKFFYAFRFIQMRSEAFGCFRSLCVLRQNPVFAGP